MTHSAHAVDVMPGLHPCFMYQPPCRPALPQPPTANPALIPTLTDMPWAFLSLYAAR